MVHAVVRSLHRLGQTHVRAEQIVHDLARVSFLLLRNPGYEVSDYVLKVDRNIELRVRSVESAAFGVREVVLLLHLLFSIYFLFYFHIYTRLV